MTDKAIQKKGRIKSLEGLRAIAFLGVMFCHTGLAAGIFNSVGEWGVSVFFVLSGFVAVYSQIEITNFKPSISYNFSYLISRIKKLYPLHILTALSLIIFELVGNKTSPLSGVLLQLGLNVALIQEWFPLAQRSINVTSWFLCTSVFFFFVFPWVLKHIQAGYSKKKAERNIAVCIFVEIIIAIVSYFLPRPVYSENMILGYNIVKWFVYMFPLSRIFDCLIGCYLGYIFICDEKKEISGATIKELIALILCITSSVIASMASPITPAGCEIPVVSYNNGWTYDLVFLPGTLSILYLFAYGQGKISKFFTKPIFMYLAKLSMYCFLIHTVVFRYIDAAVYRVIGNDKAAELFNLQYGGWIKVSIGILLSLIATQIWIWLTNRISTAKAAKHNL